MRVHFAGGHIQLESHDLKRLLARKDQIIKGLALLKIRFDELNELVAGRALTVEQEVACRKAVIAIRTRAEKLRDEFEPQLVLVPMADSSVAEPPVEAPHDLVRLHSEVQVLLDELNLRFGKGD